MKFLQHISDRLGALAAWLFFATGILLTYEVAARYVFTAPTIWAAEISQMFLIWGVFAALPRTLLRNENIAIDFLYERAPAPLQKLADIFALVFIAVFAATVAWYGFDIMWDSFVRGRSTGTMLNIPNWWTQVAIPFGFGLSAVQCLVLVTRRLHGALAAGPP